MGEAYPLLAEHAEEIERIWRGEEERFSETLARGQRVFDDLASRPGDRRGRCVHARRDVWVPDRADAGARGGARPAGGHRRLPDARWRGTASSPVPAVTRATCSAPPSSRATAGFESEFVGYCEARRADPGGRGRGPRGRDVLLQAARVAVLRRERRPDHGQRRARARGERRRRAAPRGVQDRRRPGAPLRGQRLRNR